MLAVRKRPLSRGVILADEVGLGKTIEAGLILHQLLLRERAQRVLIVVPESLVHQWLVEMLRRFNLRFALFDAQRLAYIHHRTGRSMREKMMPPASLSIPWRAARRSRHRS